MDPQTFGRYQIVRKLAGGGMGRVFLVWDTMLNRHAGLKLIDTGRDQESIDVVAAERSGAILQDQLAKREPGGRVAQIFDVGEREGYFYIAMEYVEGEDLSELVARGPLPPERAVRIAIDILAVLARAHNFETVIAGRSHRGIIHGDIKPRNIRITPHGQVKVLDFGIAKAVSMTRGITFNQYGSVPYSSPERVRTGDVDARSDVWSVAVVLFEMLTGHAYFAADTSARLEVAIREYTAKSRDLTKLQAGLREIVSRALDPDVARRFPSASAFEKALEEWRAGGQAALLAQDPEVTRRTNAAGRDENAARRAVRRDSLTKAFRNAVTRWRQPALVASLLLTIFGLVYAGLRWNRPKKPPVAAVIAKSGGTPAKPAPLIPPAPDPVRSSLMTRYSAEADQTIADYREAAEDAPVSDREWKRAEAAINSALSLAPNDTKLLGKYQIIEGHRQLASGDAKTAREDFEAANVLLPGSPDPHLGLAFAFAVSGDPDRAADELNKAKLSGFRPGPREQRALAACYRQRGERWIAAARRARDLKTMRVALKHGDGDLARAQEFYNLAVPYLDSAKLAKQAALERYRATKTIGQPSQPRRMASKGKR